MVPPNNPPAQMPSTPKSARASRSGLDDAPHSGPSCSPTPPVQPPRLSCHQLPSLDTSPAGLAKNPPTPSPSAGEDSATDVPPTKDTAPAGQDLPPSPPLVPEPELEPEGPPLPMPPKNRPLVPRRPTDLSELLTEDQLDELYNVVWDITNTIRDDICRNFESSFALPVNGPKGAGIPPSYKMRGLGVEFGEETAPSLTGQSESVARVFDATTSMTEYTDVQTSFEALKKDVFCVHRRWQTKVLQRFEEIQISKVSSTKENVGFGPRGAGALRGGGRAGAGNRTYHPQLARADGGGKPVHNGNYSTEPKCPSLRSRLLMELDVQPSMTSSDDVLAQLYPPVPNELTRLPLGHRRLLLHAVLLLLVSLEGYPPYSRMLMLNLATSLEVPARVLAKDEVRVVKGLSALAQAVCPEDAPTTRKADEIKYPQRPLAGGSVVINLPACLAAVGMGWVPNWGGVTPTTAAALLGTVVDSRIGVGTIFGFYGPRGGGKAEAYNKDVSDFAFLPLYEPAGAEFMGSRAVAPEHRRLRVVVAVSAWLMEKDDAVRVWRALGSQAETYGVRWEAEQLDRLGWAMETVAKSAAWSEAKKEIARRREKHPDFTPLSLLTYRPAPLGHLAYRAVSSVHEGCWPASLLKLSKILGHPWGSCMARAEKTGVTMAETILHRIHGERGVTLIGYSLGARAVYACLAMLFERRALGLVENAVLMGTPAPADPDVWTALRSVVTGRLINVYSETDYMLAFLHRDSCTQFGIAGLQRINKLSGIENVNATALITDHMRYHYLVGTILQDLGLEDVDAVKVSEREAELRVVEQRLNYDKRCGNGAATEEEPDSAPQPVGVSRIDIRAPTAPATKPRRPRGRARNNYTKLEI
ncbi:transmembrane and coiled-coil domain-containing protein 4 [Magnaporthiopsis poae ATCC 64411]|uniref:Transmembrane and coiled-coil domain-containing protein 4 n=1 Tax=Magnaporthiopsis poae (strain ATCC 64411 / 73-15) TaxID=644358 RepID=A0A0C4EDM0_MAGP6|nr:transmembrane and coiled-coil domain-containing protein 4 [Magnaporthiopsis poae ATCC 64411]